MRRWHAHFKWVVIPHEQLELRLKKHHVRPALRQQAARAALRPPVLQRGLHQFLGARARVVIAAVARAARLSWVLVARAARGARVLVARAARGARILVARAPWILVARGLRV